MNTQEWVEKLRSLTFAQTTALNAALSKALRIDALGVPRWFDGENYVPLADTSEPSEFDVELTAMGPNKLLVISALRQVTALSLVEAKALVESAPKLVRRVSSRVEADVLREKLEGAGAVITVR